MIFWVKCGRCKDEARAKSALDKRFNYFNHQIDYPEFPDGWGLIKQGEEYVALCLACSKVRFHLLDEAERRFMAEGP